MPAHRGTPYASRGKAQGRGCPCHTRGGGTVACCNGRGESGSSEHVVERFNRPASARSDLVSSASRPTGVHLRAHTLLARGRRRNPLARNTLQQPASTSIGDTSHGTRAVSRARPRTAHARCAHPKEAPRVAPKSFRPVPIYRFPTHILSRFWGVRHEALRSRLVSRWGNSRMFRARTASYRGERRFGTRLPMRGTSTAFFRGMWTRNRGTWNSRAPNPAFVEQKPGQLEFDGLTATAHVLLGGVVRERPAKRTQPVRRGECVVVTPLSWGGPNVDRTNGVFTERTGSCKSLRRWRLRHCSAAIPNERGDSITVSASGGRWDGGRFGGRIPRAHSTDKERFLGRVKLRRARRGAS